MALNGGTVVSLSYLWRQQNQPKNNLSKLEKELKREEMFHEAIKEKLTGEGSGHCYRHWRMWRYHTIRRGRRGWRGHQLS